MSAKQPTVDEFLTDLDHPPVAEPLNWRWITVSSRRSIDRDTSK
jgi:hypothetical protein